MSISEFDRTINTIYEKYITNDHSNVTTITVRFLVDQIAVEALNFI